MRSARLKIGKFRLLPAVSVCAQLFCATLAGAADKAEQDAHYHRWAIIASDDLQSAGLPDLLAAKLSGKPGFELVERQQLKLVTKELELSTYFGSQAVGKRLKLGQLLKADALILLSLEEHEKQKFVKLVISDCRYGARLYRLYVPYPGERLDSLAHKLVAAVLETRRRYADGIKHVIAVPQFLSKNLVHDYDHLQAGYAAILRDALRRVRGVAVLETDEARAIGREFELTGGQLKSRVVPVFVEGEFRITAHAPDEEPTVALQVRVLDGKKIQTRIERSNLSPAQVIDLLATEIPRRIVQLTEEVAPLSRKQQFERLTSRAAQFSLVGAYEQSTGIREAALLLDDDDVQLRLDVLRDYWLWIKALRRVHWETRDGSGYLTGQPLNPAIRRSIAHNLDVFRRYAFHCEQLIRRRLVNPNEAAFLLVGSTINAMSGVTAPGSPEVKQAVDAFFWNTFPQITNLDYTLNGGHWRTRIHQTRSAEPLKPQPHKPQISRDLQDQNWTRIGVSILLHSLPKCDGVSDVRRRRDNRRILTDLHRFLTEVVPQKTFLPSVVTTFAHDRYVNYLIRSGNLRRNDVRDFYERLKRSQGKHNAFYARCGLLSLRVYLPESQQLGEVALREADALLKIARDLDAELKLTIMEQAVYTPLRELRNRIAGKLKTGPAVSRHVPENPIPPVDPEPRVTFLPVEGIRPTWTGLKKCTESLDVLWSKNSVYVMPRKGVVRRIFHGPGKLESVFSVQWDGKNIWIAHSNSGIWVITPEGKTVGHIDARHNPNSEDRSSSGSLPPYDHVKTAGYVVPFRFRPLFLHAVERGKCLAIGRFGKLKRMWFAVIERDERGTFSTNVFHTVTKRSGAATDADDDPQQWFELNGLFEYQNPMGADPRRRWLLVDRHPRIGEGELGRRPLSIDLKSLDVSVFPGRLRSLSRVYWPVNGRVLTVSGALGIEVFSPPKNGESGEWTRTSLLGRDENRQSRLLGFERPLFAEPDFLFLPGARWYRIAAPAFDVELLTETPVPLSHRFRYHGDSAHYGLVSWHEGDRLYQVQIDRKVPEADRLAADYFYVPAGRRDRHHRAVERIHKLGGSVDAVWGSRLSMSRRILVPGWHTIVHLPKSWSGGDEGLKALQDLHNLNLLSLVQADVSDAGMKIVGGLKQLLSLELAETKVTDKGLAHLQNLSQLAYIRLQGLPDNQTLSDRGLAHLKKLHRLEAVMLVGGGFTNTGLQHLKGLRLLHVLSLIDTSITNDAMVQFKQSRPRRFSWQSRALPAPRIY